MSNKNIIVKEISDYSEMEKIILKFKDTFFLRAITKDTYRDVFIKKHLENGHFLAEFHDDVPVGFISFYCNDTENKKAFITSLSLSDELGFLKGKTLMRLLKNGYQIAASKGMQTVGLEVESNNYKAIKLYKHFGFEFVQSSDEKTRLMEIQLNKLKQVAI